MTSVVTTTHADATSAASWQGKVTTFFFFLVFNHWLELVILEAWFCCFINEHKQNISAWFCVNLWKYIANVLFMFDKYINGKILRFNIFRLQCQTSNLSLQRKLQEKENNQQWLKNWFSIPDSLLKIILAWILTCFNQGKEGDLPIFSNLGIFLFVFNLLNEMFILTHWISIKGTFY